MPISRKHEAIFVHIPKTGGQSVSQMLGLNKNNPGCYYGHTPEPNGHIFGGLCLTHLTISQIRERFDTTGYYIFSFVRNPYTRIISEYNWRMRNISVFREPTGKPMSFEVYCETLLERWDIITKDDTTDKHITMVQHVIPQNWYVDESVDVYRFENFKDECLTLCDKLGLNPFVPKVNYGSYKTQHTDRTREITAELYRKDFEMFGYTI